MSVTTNTVADATRITAEKWFSALKAGNGAEALSCLDDNITWINNPSEKGLSDIVPWLGEYHGLAAVKETFVIWGALSAVKEFELVQLVVNDDEVFAIVHEVAEIKATGLNYDIEFIQRFKVANNKIVFWKSYWDTVKGIVPFRGDMERRLVAAAKVGNTDELDLVLPFGGNANTMDVASGQTLLMIASGRGYTSVVKKLLDYGADPNAMDKRAGTTALHKACQGRYLEVVKLLVTAGAFIDIQSPTTGHTPLVEAIWYKADDIVAYLLEENARIGLNTYYGFNIDQHIEYAKMVNDGKIGKVALERIARLVDERRQKDAQSKDKQELNNAVINGNMTQFHIALSNKENVDQRYPMACSFDDEHTPLLIAARDAYKNEAAYSEMVKLLIGNKADVNAVEPIFGAVPLHKATYNGNKTVTELLSKAPGINLNYQGPSNGYTPLHDALWHGFADCAEVLLDAGARIDIIGYDGKLPVDIAIEELGETHPIVKRLQALSPLTR